MKKSMAALLLVLAVASPSMAADLKGDLVAMEKSAWKAWYDHDAKTYGDMMTEDAMQVPASGTIMSGRKQVLDIQAKETCKLNSFDFADTKVRQLSPDVAILTYTATQDVTCKDEKVPPKVFATSVYVRQGGKWRWSNYQETVHK